jgi:hypothetical protein
MAIDAAQARDLGTSGRQLFRSSYNGRRCS